MTNNWDIWADYEGRISAAERLAISLAPVEQRPELQQWCAFYTPQQLHNRYLAHWHVSALSYDLVTTQHSSDRNYKAFGRVVALAVFELRGGFVTSWPGFALLFRKMLRAENAHWFANAFLAAIAEPDVGNVDYDFNEVLGFAQRFNT